MNKGIRLTNGIEAFSLGDGMTYDEIGPASGIDCNGGRYNRCDMGSICDHSEAPQGALVFHDEEHTETLWVA